MRRGADLASRRNASSDVRGAERRGEFEGASSEEVAVVHPAEGLVEGA
jgi:hypothetical protein